MADLPAAAGARAPERICLRLDLAP